MLSPSATDQLVEGFRFQASDVRVLVLPNVLASASVDLVLRHGIDQLLSAAGPAVVAELGNALMCDHLAEHGFLPTPAVEQAFRFVRRDLFLPGCDLRDVYSDRAVSVRRDGGGAVLSSCSAPSIIATMIEALRLEDGCRVLEVGTGTGYSAALMAHAHPNVEVTTLEILEDVSDAAAARMARFGLADRVAVRTDGLDAIAGEGAPFDRVVLACSIDALPAAWTSLLVDGGRLVAPVGHVIHELERRGDRLAGRPLVLADFVAYREEDDVGWTGDASSWVSPGRSVWMSDPEDAAAASRVLCRQPDAEWEMPALPLDRLATPQLLLSLAHPGCYFHFFTRERGWGFGLLDAMAGAAVACILPGEVSSRHYPGRCEHPRLEVFGEGAPLDGMVSVLDRLEPIGWPRLTDVTVRVVPREAAEPASARCATVDRGEQRWCYELPTFAAPGGPV